MFVASKCVFCHDKNMLVLSRQHVFVMTKHIFCCNKSMLVTTNVLSWQKLYLWQLPPIIRDWGSAAIQHSEQMCFQVSASAIDCWGSTFPQKDCQQGRLSVASSFYAFLLRVVSSVMSLALCPQIVSQAPQHFRSSEAQATCDGCFAPQTTWLVIYLDSGTSSTVCPQESSKLDVEHWRNHQPWLKSHSIFLLFPASSSNLKEITWVVNGGTVLTHHFTPKTKRCLSEWLVAVPRDGLDGLSNYWVCFLM